MAAIPVQVIPAGASEMVPAVLRSAPCPAPGVYWVGVRGGPDVPAVVLQRTDDGEALTYELAGLGDAGPAGQTVGVSP